LLKSSQESFENLQHLQTQLVQSEKLASLGQLVGGAAHELNNPLTAMMGYSDLLAATPLDNEQRSLAQKIEHQIRRTRTLVSSMLSFAKQVPAEKSRLDINALVQTAVRLHPPQLRSARIQVHTDLAAGLPPVLGDSNQLLQVCMHVTNNALHAMAEKGGVLQVTTRRLDDWVVIEFSGDGTVIQEPDRGFDPHSTSRLVGQGAGLGVCYGILQEHHGKISCENRPQGGAIVRIEIPAVVEADSTRSNQLFAFRSDSAARAASRP
jgi:two-component system NtrC family sensor kinase